MRNALRNLTVLACAAAAPAQDEGPYSSLGFTAALERPETENEIPSVRGIDAVGLGEREAIRRALQDPASQPSPDLRTINGTSLFVKRIGRGEPIVIVHGGPMLDHGYLVSGLAALADDYELVFYDQRLQGRSAGTVEPSSVRLQTFVDDLEALRTSLGYERIHVLAHSWGALVAMHYAVEHGEHLRSLILLDPTAPSSELSREEERSHARLTDEDRAAMAAIRATPEFQARRPDAIARMLRATFAPQFHDREALARLELYVPEDYVARSQQLAGLGSDLASFDLLEELRAVRAPVLVVYGADEPGAEVSGPRWREALPQARLLVVPEAGHFPFLEQPEALQRELRAFLSAKR
jgi:proline iminopeptidase